MRKKLLDALNEAYNLFNHLHEEVMHNDQTCNARSHQTDA